VTPATGRLVRWILTGVIVVFLVLFARTVDWAAAWQSIRSASLPLLALSLGVNFLSVVIKGLRWWLFLKPAGSPSLPLAIRATIAGAGLNNVLVANGGDAARVVFVARATGIPSSTVLATLALERLFDPVGFVILIVYAAVAYTLPPALEAWRIPAQVALILIAILIGWFLHLARKPSVPRDAAYTAPHGLRNRFRRYVAVFATSTRSLATPQRFFGALVISMAAWILQVLTFKYAADAAHVPMSTAACIATLIAVNLGLLIRATPGNVGFFQFVFAVTAAQFAIGRDDAIAVSLLIQTIQIIPVALIGVALAPEFIFRSAKSGASGTAAEKSEELAVISREA
jgi:uncharacterized protein (TIRG00374 family)